MIKCTVCGHENLPGSFYCSNCNSDIVIGKRKDAYAAATESSAFPTLNFEIEYYLGPEEILFITPEGFEQRQKPGDKLQICSFCAC